MCLTSLASKLIHSLEPRGKGHSRNVTGLVFRTLLVNVADANTVTIMRESNMYSWQECPPSLHRVITRIRSLQLQRILLVCSCERAFSAVIDESTLSTSQVHKKSLNSFTV
jgi:hypothetical protein